MQIKKGININCSACNIEFYVPPYRMKNAKFCSRLCQNHTQYEKYIFKCTICNKECVTSPSRKNYNKKFCSLECREYSAKTTKQRRLQQKISRKISRGTITGRTLRKIVFAIKPKKCEICGYDEYDFCLDTHHIDENADNNDISNIAILCCMCHRKLHKKIITLGIKDAS